ncbi:DUF58 domain-containing protein [Rhodoferax sp. 4810]|uniref:DUF58 domain-containing protein n=1 Tax=Thiospirillum jenense TaxID=1653858 RepID=A0A839H769_9GAMM|nr:DUF58 domain-containing protein [Thiospirillum jenense]MBB1073804.1 DUF58 domain-containing protein [Rhodoferax jenense]MBB1125241.1 DUF58 domain-containing protein [Thiospirillum jenense]
MFTHAYSPDDPRQWCVSADDLIALRTQVVTGFNHGRYDSPFAGLHRTHRRGRGMDYREARHYQAGDDLRNMDWRITARTGRPHVKVFDEERERPVMVVVDCGAGMFFASRGAFKMVLAARLAALFGWSAIAHGDRIGAALLSDPPLELPPRGGRSGQMRLIRALVAAGEPTIGLHNPPNPAALPQALARLLRVARPGSQVILLSDFHHLTADVGQTLQRLARHTDLRAVQLIDPLELKPPPPGQYAIRTAAGGGIIDTHSRVARQRYVAQLQQAQARLETLMAQSGVALVRVLTSDDAVSAFAQLARATPRRPLLHVNNLS